MKRKIIYGGIIFTIILLFVAGAYLGFTAFDKERPIPQGIDRGGVVTEKQIQEIQSGEKTVFNFERFMSAVFLFVGGIVVLANQVSNADNKKWLVEHDKKNDLQWTEHNQKHDIMQRGIDLVVDKEDIEIILRDLRSITSTATYAVPKANIKILLDSIGDRTARFIESTITKNMSQELFDYALVKIESLSKECQIQLDKLEFTKEFKEALLSIQAEEVIELTKDLKRILDDNIENHKFKRYSLAVKNFLRRYSNKTIEAYYEFEFKK